jgi:hypothetical protein
MSTTMADEQTAETLANETTEVPATPVNDGIIDLDAQEEVKDEGDESKDGEADKAGDKPDEEDKPKKLSGAATGEIREARLLNELAETNRRLEEPRAPSRRKTLATKRNHRARKTTTATGSHGNAL